MFLSSIAISNLRNLKNINIEFGERFNIFYGENGAGKSSILEAIYLLSTGKSFRTHQVKKVISHNQTEIMLFSKVEDENGRRSSLGLSKSLTGHEIRINGNSVKNISELALRLPVLVATQDSHKLIDSGPQWRRQFLDWGLFHVEHEFHDIWKNYKKILKQRNSALVRGCSKDEIEVWDSSLSVYGSQYNLLRESFIEQFKPYFIEFSRYLLGESEYNLEYNKGWPKVLDYAEALSNHVDKDRVSKRTEYGPHKSDLRIMVNLQNSRDTASRGQQKLLVYALNLALIAYMQEKKGLKTLMLLDDLGSELDPAHAEKLFNLLWERFAQVCITTANLNTLPLESFGDVRLFHVKHGEISEVKNQLVEL